MHAIFADALTKLFISLHIVLLIFLNIEVCIILLYRTCREIIYRQNKAKLSIILAYPHLNVSYMYWNCHSTDEQTSKALGGCVQIVIRTSSDGSHSLTKRPISASYLQSLRFLRNLELLSLHLNCLPTTMAFKYAKYNFFPFIHTYGCTIIIG